MTSRAARIRHRARLLLPRVFEVVSLNDDFTTRATDAPSVLRARQPLALGIQEGKATDYRARVGSRWGVRQRLALQATAGVAVLWDLDRARAVGVTKDNPKRTGHGWLPLVSPRPGEDMLTRGVVWQDVRVLDAGRVVRLASTHRPPWRHRHHWREFDQGLDSWLALSPVPVVLMLDNNSTRRPNLNARWRWHGAGIDGVLTDLPVRSVLQLHQRRSDHAPVSIAVRIPRKRSPQ